MTTRRAWLTRMLLAAPATAAGLAGCAGLGGPRTITLGREDLLRRLAREFPIERRWLELFDLRLSEPTLALLPERNRLAAGFALSAVERLGGRRRDGRVAFETALRWDEASQSLRLAEVHVQSLQLDGLGAAGGSSAQRLGRLLAEQWLEGLPVYTLRDEDRRRLAASGLAPGAVTVTSAGVEISLSPLR